MHNNRFKKQYQQNKDKENTKMKLLTLVASSLLALSITPLNPVNATSYTSVNEDGVVKVETSQKNININIQKQIFTTETSTILKNAEMIALMSGEKPASSDTLWKASNESGYAGNSKPKNWGNNKSKSVGKNGSITVIRKNLYKLEKNSKTGLGKTKCSVTIQATPNKLETRNLNCKSI
jgi:cell division protein FtsB